MARPAGHPLNRDAWDDVLRLTCSSLTTIADGADIARSTLSGLVSGRHAASAPVAARIAKAAGVNTGTLFPTLGHRDLTLAEPPVEAAAS